MAIPRRLKPPRRPNGYRGAVVIGNEAGHGRSRRRQQRTSFDDVAQLYDASRLGYPSEIVEYVVSTAGLGVGSAVLEVGCGTGQLTERFACLEFDLTAIDIGLSMIAAARRRLGDSAVSFHVTSFEDFAVADGSFDLIISGNAFHWVDPEVKFHKSARLLRPGGWLALLSTGELYDDPLGAALLDMWVARSNDNGAWVKQPKPADAEIIASTGSFEVPIHKTHAQRIVVPVDMVVGLENTRATSLSWPDDVRRGFTEELRHHLRSQTDVRLTQQTSLTMARGL